MKKFKLNSVIASLLSLGITCSGSVFASGNEDGSKAPKPPKSYEISKSHKLVKNSQEDEESNETVRSFTQEEINEDLKRKFIYYNRKGFEGVLDDLKGVELCKGFPQTIEQLAAIAFNEKDSEFFLSYLDRKMEQLEYEEKEEGENENEIGALYELSTMVENADDEDVYHDLFGA